MEDTLPLLAFIVTFIVWFFCVAAAGEIGGQRESGGMGFMFGLLFGPLGVIMAGFLDGRQRCPRCGERVNRGYSLCPHCGLSLTWTKVNPRIMIVNDVSEAADPPAQENSR
ncbi:MAG: hypothetical protein JW818_12005 [Pirellulales bacterium]|nr:hypothetical protein [Pirellulales bacterium]